MAAIILYVSSFVGDLFDGMAARKFNQCSEFGGMLDMVTDRCATLGLFFILSGEYGAINQEHSGARTPTARYKVKPSLQEFLTT